jgi:hypothetical protein
MEAEMSLTAKLLRGSSDEEKFAGIMLSLKLVEMGKLDEKDSKAVLMELYGLISPVFVIKLMRITKKRRFFRQTCISLIANSIQLGFSNVYRDHTIKLIDVMFFSLDLSAKTPQTVAEGDSLGGSQTSSSNTEDDRTFELDLLLALKWIAAGATSADVYKLLSHTLKRTGGINFELPVYIYSALLDFLVDLCQLLSRPDTSENSHIERFTLPTEEAALFRKLIVKGFHGGAPESIRDSSLFCCLHFLDLNSSVHPSWSVGILEDKQSDIASDKGDKQGSGKFAMLLVSVIGIEVHLLLEEALALFKKPEGEPLEHSYGDLRDPKEERRKRYNEVGTDACISNTSVRVERISSMIPCCMSLLTAILELLIGNEKIESGSSGVVAELYWSHLPSPAMLHIRQTVQNIFQKIFDFLKEISDVSQSSISHVFKKKNQGFENTDAVTLTNGHDTLLLRIIQQATATMCFWVLEDEDLRDPFLSNLPNILRWSAVTVHFDDSDNANSCKLRESIYTYGVDWEATTSEAWTSITAGPTGSAMSGGSDDVCDVMHHVLPCLAAMSSNLTAKDELAERLCTLDKGSLFARLINITVLLGLNASNFFELDMTNSEQSATSHKNHPLNETDATSSTSATSLVRNGQTFSSALNLLECYFSWKQKEIQTLTLGETEVEALTDIFCISKDLFPKIRIANSSALSLTVKGSQNQCLTRDLADVLDRARHILCDSVGNGNNEPVTKEILSLNSAISALVRTLRTFSTT